MCEIIKYRVVVTANGAEHTMDVEATSKDDALLTALERILGEDWESADVPTWTVTEIEEE